jgi:peptidoglycan/xylan/chitin deacetylase (PgdA/CDA1 family)
MSLAMSLRARGPAGSAARTARVLSRFGATARPMASRLELYQTIARDLAAQPTWPTTACVLARHPDLLRGYVEAGAELALHGLVHGDHAAIDRARQREAIARAADVFERAGVAAVGFRGPYLRYNESTREVLRELGLRYHSSQAVVFPLVDPDLERSPAYQLALRLYGAHDALRVAVRPRLLGQLVDIPVAVPDDEIIVERLRLNDLASSAQWLAILEFTYARGDLFTLQLHPERIPELGDALRATLSEARRKLPHVFVARLDEIASWWLRRSRFALNVRRLERERYRVVLEADRDATLLVRGLDVPAAPWHGRDTVARVFDFETSSSRAPIVAVSKRTPSEVGRFLIEEGFAVEVSDDAQAHGATIDLASTAWSEADVLAAVEAAPGPLVRLSRWPRGARSALAVTGDIDALTLRDFVVRSWETRGYKSGGSRRL